MSHGYHVEAIGPETRGRPVEVVQRTSVQSDSLERVRQRAIHLLQRSQVPQWAGGKVDAVRVLDGTGTEVFRWSVWDELSKITR